MGMPHLHMGIPNLEPPYDSDNETDFDEGEAAIKARSEFVRNALEADPDDVEYADGLLNGAVDFYRPRNSGEN